MLLAALRHTQGAHHVKIPRFGYRNQWLVSKLTFARIVLFRTNVQSLTLETTTMLCIGAARLPVYALLFYHCPSSCPVLCVLMERIQTCCGLLTFGVMRYVCVNVSRICLWHANMFELWSRVSQVLIHRKVEAAKMTARFPICQLSRM
jgi:hypothetical protein